MPKNAPAHREENTVIFFIPFLFLDLTCADTLVYVKMAQGEAKVLSTKPLVGLPPLCPWDAQRKKLLGREHQHDEIARK